MKAFISISALFLSLSLTAQTNPATWYLNDTSGGIQSNTNTASGIFSVAMGYATIAIGQYSTSMGRDTSASGTYSTALGAYTIASGDFSTAMGYSTTASGSSSTAIGANTEASGIGSTAMGYNSTASDWSSLVMGQFNLSGSTVTTSATEFSLDNTAFVVGNGTDSDSRSDALVVKFNGDATLAGSMTATSFIGDGSQLTNLPSSGVDSPFSYNSNEAGGIEVANYTTASGSRAFAVGADSQASGNYSTAMGRGTIASGDDSTAIGANTEASGIGSTAMGVNTTASGPESTAMGWQTKASGGWSTAMGDITIASGENSTAMGYNSTASGIGSTAVGISTTASGTASTAMGGYTTASGDGSTAMGGYTTASDYASVVIGQFNSSGSSATSATSFSTYNPAFVIGNGTGSDIRSDALTVLFDGTTTIAGDFNVNSDKKVFFGSRQSFIEGATEGTVLILNANNNILFRPGGTTAVNFETNGDAIFNGDVKVTSDKRLKSNIISLGGTLAKLLQIDGKSYTMKKDESEKQKIGLLAQDIEKVFPELVSESHGVKSVNYQGLVPVLINALKEQDAMMKEQESKYLKQEKRLERLERLVAAMD